MMCKKHHWPNEEGPCPHCKIDALETLVGLLSMEVSDLMGLYLAHFPDFVGWPEHADIGRPLCLRVGEPDPDAYLRRLKEKAKALIAKLSEEEKPDGS